MATQTESESLGKIGKGLAGGAVRLVKAELALAKAEVLAALWRIALVLGSALFAGVSLILFFIFALGTVDEGQKLSDNWALGAAILSMILALLSFSLMGKGSFFKYLGGLFVLGFVGLSIAFFVLILLATGPEAARQGWAITSLVFLGLSVLTSGVAVMFGLKLKSGLSETIKTVKEDAGWLKQLIKRDAKES